MNCSSSGMTRRLKVTQKECLKLKIKQSKEELFEKIQERLQEGDQTKRKKKSWFVPTASAAVLFLLIILIPSFLNEKDLTLEDTKMVEEEAGMMMEVERNIVEAPGITSTEEMFKTEEASDSSQPIYIGAVHPSVEDNLRENLITLAVPISSLSNWGISDPNNGYW
ncbi:hypothetical protein KHA80_09010 [Anaerobacillus sp. HL2]|nr:hypothetical protein KHA80_09010 [Anaerobacillus sp. HL2]